jgi:transcriptional regulator with XRE-family HTH domain
LSNITKIIGERLRNIRKQQGLSQEVLAEKAGLHNTYIGQVERGEKNLTIETLEKIVTALNTSFEDLFSLLQPSNITADKTTLNTLLSRLNTLTIDEQMDILAVIEVLMKWKESK